MTGCQRFQTTIIPEEKVFKAPCLKTVSPAVQYHIIGSSVENRAIGYLVLGEGQDVIFIIASIHGNETAGTPLVLLLAQYLQDHYDLLEGRKLVILPVANPDGMFNNSRYNANGIDLNRNFPTRNRINSPRFGRAAFSEPETRIIDLLIQQYDPDRIVSLHEPLACVDYDGPGETLAEHMAECCNLSVKKLGARPGSLGSYTGETLGIPTITLELTEHAKQFDSEYLWELYGEALISAVIYPDIVELYTFPRERHDESGEEVFFNNSDSQKAFENEAVTPSK